MALVQRGEFSFREKSIYAKEAGADAVIVYNDEPGNFAGTLEFANDYIPTFSMSLEDAQVIMETSLKTKILQ